MMYQTRKTATSQNPNKSQENKNLDVDRLLVRAVTDNILLEVYIYRRILHVVEYSRIILKAWYV